MKGQDFMTNSRFSSRVTLFRLIELSSQGFFVCQFPNSQISSNEMMLFHLHIEPCRNKNENQSPPKYKTNQYQQIPSSKFPYLPDGTALLKSKVFMFHIIFILKFSKVTTRLDVHLLEASPCSCCNCWALQMASPCCFSQFSPDLTSLYY